MMSKKLTFLCIFLIWIIIPVVVMSFYPRPDNPGIVGDTFGIVSSLYASLGFFGVILTLNAQSKEIKITQEATKIEKETNSMAAQLSILPEMIKEVKSSLHEIDATFKKYSLSRVQVQELIEKENVGSVSAKNLLRELHELQVHQMDLFNRLKDLSKI